MCPTQSLLTKWLREKHKYYVQPHYESGGWYYRIYALPSDEDIELSKDGGEDGDLFLRAQFINNEWYFEQEIDTYEEALEQGLYNALEIVKNEMLM